MVDNDPPAHGRFRGLVQKAFTARRIVEKEPIIRAIAAELAEELVPAGRADLFARFAHPLPALVIAGILGVPATDTHRFRSWSDAWAGMLVGQGTLQEQLACARGVVEFQRYLASSLEERMGSPRNDLLSDIATAARAQQPPPSMPELVGMLMQVLFAGHETTAGLIAGAVELLLHHPEQLQALREDPGLIPAALEEAVRLTSPVGAMFRTALEDVEVGGVRIAKGSHLRLAFTSANRDEACFHEPQRFDVRRADAKHHIAFGQGIHFCIGAPLARTEARIALEELLPRLPGLRRAPGQAPGFLRSPTVRRLERLEVEWDVPPRR
jgi:cytochrome P450